MNIQLNDIFILNDIKNNKYTRRARAVKVLSITKTHVYVKFLFLGSTTNLDLKFFGNDYSKIDSDIFNTFNNKVKDLFQYYYELESENAEDKNKIMNLINLIENNYYIKLSNLNDLVEIKEEIQATLNNIDVKDFIKLERNLNNLFISID